MYQSLEGVIEMASVNDRVTSLALKFLDNPNFGTVNYTIPQKTGIREQDSIEFKDISLKRTAENSISIKHSDYKSVHIYRNRKIWVFRYIETVFKADAKDLELKGALL